MKYIILLIFNAAAFYILGIFILGSGGIVQNLQKLQQINRLEEMKAKSELDVEDLKFRLKYFQSQNIPDASALAKQGKKSENMVIFKYIEKQGAAQPDNNDTDHFAYYRIFFSAAFSVFIILLGNILLCMNLARRAV